ncbi:ras-related protein Rab-17 isoform X1 [Dendropsophus ebraccatus]|uniref:ras-related protein Rab-17 isoform X1 n=1 Tax=Dendropsophus ebraccatus TaxID=150705 RepID=UPI00383171E9
MALMESCESLTDDVFKLVLLGSSEVGKSSLVIRYVRDVFRETLSTTGCAFFSHRAYVQGRSINLEIWDTAGQERFQSLCHIYYRGANAALLVYDITSKETLSRAQFWLQELQKYALNGDMVIALVGNKSDLQDYRTVPSEDAQAFAKMNQLLFMETSAKTGNGVKEIFDKVASELLTLEQQNKDKQLRRNFHFTLEETHPSGIRQRCCNFQ